MNTPTTLRALAALIESLTTADMVIDEVQPTGQQLVTNELLNVQLSARFKLEDTSDFGSAVTISLPDDTSVQLDQPTNELTIPFEVEIDARDLPTENTQHEISETELTDGGVAMTASEPTNTPSRRASTDGHPDQQAGVTTASSSTANSSETETTSAPAPHRNPDRLRDVYETYETFPEMTEALASDVTPQTVRHHMIKHGIHEPNTREETSSPPNSTTSNGETITTTSATTNSTQDESAEETSEPIETTHTTSTQSTDAGRNDHVDDASDQNENGATDVTSGDTAATDDVPRSTTHADAETEHSGDKPSEGGDGVGPTKSPADLTAIDPPADVDLPSHVTLTDICDAVAEATTLYEVQRELRIDRSTARQLLDAFDLLKFVGGRLSTADEQTSPIDQIETQIRQICT